MPLPSLPGRWALFPALPGHGFPLTNSHTHCSSAGPRAPLLRFPCDGVENPRLDLVIAQEHV